jgi:hypothetical protein
MLSPPRAFAASLVVISALLASAPARAGWTFCIAETSTGDDVWISGVFEAERDRDRLEGDLRAYLKGRGVANPVAQCPQPRDDKTEAVNAEITAAEFQRKLNRTLHEIPAASFERR